MALIAVDFDNVIRRADNTPCPNARAGLALLRERGHEILIHSCNNPKFIEQWLNDQDIRVDGIHHFGEWQSKPIADLYVDDKGYHFERDGDWDLEVGQILNRLERRPAGGF